MDAHLLGRTRLTSSVFLSQSTGSSFTETERRTEAVLKGWPEGNGGRPEDSQNAEQENVSTRLEDEQGAG